MVIILGLRQLLGIDILLTLCGCSFISLFIGGGVRCRISVVGYVVWVVVLVICLCGLLCAESEKITCGFGPLYGSESLPLLI